MAIFCKERKIVCELYSFSTYNRILCTIQGCPWINLVVTGHCHRWQAYKHAIGQRIESWYWSASCQAGGGGGQHDLHCDGSMEGRSVPLIGRATGISSCCRVLESWYESASCKPDLKKLQQKVHDLFCKEAWPAGAAQLRACGNSCCYYIWTECLRPSPISRMAGRPCSRPLTSL